MPGACLQGAPAQSGSSGGGAACAARRGRCARFGAWRLAANAHVLVLAAALGVAGAASYVYTTIPSELTPQEDRGVAFVPLDRTGGLHGGRSRTRPRGRWRRSPNRWRSRAPSRRSSPSPARGADPIAPLWCCALPTGPIATCPLRTSRARCARAWAASPPPVAFPSPLGPRPARQPDTAAGGCVGTGLREREGVGSARSWRRRRSQPEPAEHGDGLRGGSAAALHFRRPHAGRRPRCLHRDDRDHAADPPRLARGDGLRRSRPGVPGPAAGGTGDRSSPSDIDFIFVRAGDGTSLVPLSSLVT